MSELVQTDSEIFAGGPPIRLERSLGLIKPDNPRIIQRTILAGVIGWAPLVILTVAQDSAWWGEKVRSLLLDLAVPARSLIAAPLFIFAELLCIPQLGTTVRHFLDAGLVRESDRERFDAAVEQLPVGFLHLLPPELHALVFDGTERFARKGLVLGPERFTKLREEAG